MNVAERTIPVCILGSGVAGGIAAHGAGGWWSIAGSLLGVPVGVASYFALVLPYVYAMTRPENETGPAPMFRWLFLPLMAAAVLLSVLANWFLVGWLVGTRTP
jgi:hypothetical protein